MKEFFIRTKYPPQQADKKQKEDNEGDNRPQGDVINALEYVFIHDFLILL